MAVGQVEKHDERSRAFVQSGYGRRAVLAHDQVALPVARDGAVLDLSRALADVDHVGDPGPALITFAMWPAQGSTSTQMDRQLAPQRASALNVDGLVDGPVAHPHLRVLRELLVNPHLDLPPPHPPPPPALPHPPPLPLRD